MIRRAEERAGEERGTWKSWRGTLRSGEYFIRVNERRSGGCSIVAQCSVRGAVEMNLC